MVLTSDEKSLAEPELKIKIDNNTFTCNSTIVFGTCAQERGCGICTLTTIEARATMTMIDV